MLDLAGLDDCTIVDAGCGTGDFAEHLLSSKVDFVRYIGIDAVPEVIEAAKRRNLQRCEFHMGDLIHNASPLFEIKPDFVCVSGTLNTMDEPIARRLVTSAFEASVQGVVFNFLSDRPAARWNDHDIGPARRFNTIEWIDWALSKTARVSFTQDYLDGHDATIFMRHEG
jgi:SAM-dependent methyltransferase